MPELPHVLGSEVAGELAGQRVLALPRAAGGYAERVEVDPQWIFPLPDNASFAAGASFLTTYLTAYIPLQRQVRVTPASTVLVHAGLGRRRLRCDPAREAARREGDRDGVERREARVRARGRCRRGGRLRRDRRAARRRRDRSRRRRRVHALAAAAQPARRDRRDRLRGWPVDRPERAVARRAATRPSSASTSGG